MVVEIPYKPSGEPLIEFVEFEGANFKTVTWKVPDAVERKGKIVYVHGFAEHSSIYTEFFDKLSSKGYEIFFFDQRGAGETSPGKEIGRTNEYHVFKDLDFMIKRILDKREDTTEKLILAGHSMGGSIALNYAIKGTYKNSIKKIFVSGPLVKLHPKTEPNFILRVLMPSVAKILPNIKVDAKLNYDYITSNERWKNYLKQHDKKLLGTIRQYYDMFVRGELLLDENYVSKFDSGINLLLLHGTTDYVNWVDKSEDFTKLLGKDVQKKFVPVSNGRHSLFIEADDIFDSVFKEVIEFLDQV